MGSLSIVLGKFVYNIFDLDLSYIKFPLLITGLKPDSNSD